MRTDKLNRNDMIQSEKVTEDLFQLKALMSMLLSDSDTCDPKILRVKVSQFKALNNKAIEDLIKLSYTVKK